MLNTAPHLRGFQKGDRNPTSVVAGEGSQGEGESKHPLPVRLFGDFLFAQKVTPRSDQQCDTAKRFTKHARSRSNSRSHPVYLYICCLYTDGVTPSMRLNTAMKLLMFMYPASSAICVMLLFVSRSSSFASATLRRFM